MTILKKESKIYHQTKQGKQWNKLSIRLALVLVLAAPAIAANISSEVTLFKNVNIFDGENEKLLEGYDFFRGQERSFQFPRGLWPRGYHVEKIVGQGEIKEHYGV